MASDTLRVRADRRGHPHRDRTAGHRDRRSDAGAKVHTGRSRNDQIATDMRLFCRRELAALAGRVIALQQVLLDRASAAGDTYLPGYTHLQRAQPVLLAHHLLAHGWALARDVDRLRQTVRGSTCQPARCGCAGRIVAAARPGRRSQHDLGFAAVVRRTRSTRSATETSWPRRCSTSRCSACTCRGSPRRSCCGRPRSSVSCVSTTRTRPAVR